MLCRLSFLKGVKSIGIYIITVFQRGRKCFLLLPILLHATFANAQSLPVIWQPLAKGLDYTQIILPRRSLVMGSLHAFRIHLSDYTLRLILAQDHHAASGSVKELAQHNKAVLAINGGFFDETATPLGLRIQDHQVRSPLRPISWWGVFYIRNNEPYIVAQSQFKADAEISIALQAGPRLVIQNQIPALKSGQDERSILCITQENDVVIAVTEHTTINTHDLAALLRASNQEGGLNCRDALNLDGGSSSQLYANINNFTLDIASFSPVSDVITVTPKVN
jgi:uncharacterized protein YigE (DUF2233 family)